MLAGTEIVFLILNHVQRLADDLSIVVRKIMFAYCKLWIQFKDREGI